MKVDELLDLHKSICDEARDLMKSKNHDYTSGSNDPFANFRGSEQYGVHPVIGILIRVGDKFKRIQTFIEKGTLLVQDESVKDAFRDSINYLILGYGMVVDQTVKTVEEDFGPQPADWHETLKPTYEKSIVNVLDKNADVNLNELTALDHEESSILMAVRSAQKFNEDFAGTPYRAHCLIRADRGITFNLVLDGENKVRCQSSYIGDLRKEMQNTFGRKKPEHQDKPNDPGGKTY